MPYTPLDFLKNMLNEITSKQSKGMITHYDNQYEYIIENKENKALEMEYLKLDYFITNLNCEISRQYYPYVIEEIYSYIFDKAIIEYEKLTGLSNIDDNIFYLLNNPSEINNLDKMKKYDGIKINNEIIPGVIEFQQYQIGNLPIELREIIIGKIINQYRKQHQKRIMQLIELLYETK